MHGPVRCAPLWTLPTRRVILIANNDAAEASYASLGNWWSGLNYG